MSESMKFLALLGLLGGCVPKIGTFAARDVSLAVPDRLPAEAGTIPASGPSAAWAGWAAFFDDPTLVALIDVAVHNNQELGIRLQEANLDHAEYIARRGEYLPRVGLGAGAGMERVGRFTSQGASDASDDIEPGKKVPENLGDLRYGLQASWEVDLWKRMRNASQAAQLRYFASLEGRNFAITGVVAEVANTYYELLALDARLTVLDENVKNLQDALAVVRAQKEAARATEMAVQRFEADLDRRQAERELVRMDIVAAEARLNVLCGRFPQPIERRASTFTASPVSPAVVGTPGELLENRPDIRAAELRVSASRLDVKSARAAFYPTLGLDAGVGFDAFTLAKLPTLESLAFEVAGGLLMPLVNRADLKAGYLGANARQNQAVLEYERSVIGAFADVATQQARLDHLATSTAFRNQQVGKLQAAAEISKGLFGSARLDYLEVLTTRRDVLEAEMEQIETQLQLLEARVAMYEALGGGWRDAVPSASSPASMKSAPKETP